MRKDWAGIAFTVIMILVIAGLIIDSNVKGNRIAELERSVEVMSKNIGPMFQEWKEENGYMLSDGVGLHIWIPGKHEKQICKGAIDGMNCNRDGCERATFYIHIPCKKGCK